MIVFYISETLDGLNTSSSDTYLTHREQAPAYTPELFSCGVHLRGRFVRVMMNKNETGLFCFNEIEVYGSVSTTTTGSPTTTTTPTTTTPTTSTTTPTTTTTTPTTTTTTKPSTTPDINANLALNKQVVNNSEAYGSYNPQNAVDGVGEGASLSGSFCSKTVSNLFLYPVS